MKTIILKCGAISALVLCYPFWASAGGEIKSQTETIQTRQTSTEVVTRGPVHEAFAEPTIFNPQPGLVINREPPADIKEVPPDEKPSADAIWINGYWGWDAATNDFLWVSGVWRIPPPGRRWVEGYWTQVSDGWQWVSGYWASAAEEQVTYLPAPPATLENGPTSPQPGADYVWIPGHWVFVNDAYEWSPGYWTEIATEQVYVPAEYAWTPRGYVFVDGYWDYPTYMRGLLFAPVTFTRAAYAAPGFYYTPDIVVDPGYLADNLFVYPSYDHYCFGDFYDHRFYDSGILPGYAFYGRHRGYCDIFAFERWRHRHDHHDWDSQQRTTYERRVQDPGLRPPHTYSSAAMTQRTDNGTRFSSGGSSGFSRMGPLSAALSDRNFKAPFSKLGSTRTALITRNTQTANVAKETKPSKITLQQSTAQTGIPRNLGVKSANPVSGVYRRGLDASKSGAATGTEIKISSSKGGTANIQTNAPPANPATSNFPSQRSRFGTAPSLNVGPNAETVLPGNVSRTNSQSINVNRGDFNPARRLGEVNTALSGQLKDVPSTNAPTSVQQRNYTPQQTYHLPPSTFSDRSVRLPQAGTAGSEIRGGGSPSGNLGGGAGMMLRQPESFKAPAGGESMRTNYQNRSGDAPDFGWQPSGGQHYGRRDR